MTTLTAASQVSRLTSIPAVPHNTWAGARVRVRARTGAWTQPKGYAIGRDFTPEQLAEMNRVLEELRPLWRCDDLPLEYFLQVNVLPSGNKLDPGIAGLTFGHRPIIAFSDGINGTSWSFRYGVAHELAHALLQNADPRSCQRFNVGYANPLVQFWMQHVGWDSNSKYTSPRPIPGTNTPEQPPTDYAHSNPLEDMADSFALWLADREDFQRIAPWRSCFFDWLFRDELKASIPTGFRDKAYFIAKTGRS